MRGNREIIRQALVCLFLVFLVSACAETTDLAENLSGGGSDSWEKYYSDRFEYEAYVKRHCTRAQYVNGVFADCLEVNPAVEDEVWKRRADLADRKAALEARDAEERRLRASWTPTPRPTPTATLPPTATPLPPTATPLPTPTPTMEPYEVCYELLLLHFRGETWTFDDGGGSSAVAHPSNNPTFPEGCLYGPAYLDAHDLVRAEKLEIWKATIAAPVEYCYELYLDTFRNSTWTDVGGYKEILGQHDDPEIPNECYAGLSDEMYDAYFKAYAEVQQEMGRD